MAKIDEIGTPGNILYRLQEAENRLRDLELRKIIAPVEESFIFSTRMNDFSFSKLSRYFLPIHKKNENLEFRVSAYAHGVTAVSGGYEGGVYSPTQNRIYLVPYAQSNQTNWHYINCTTGAVVAYAHGATAVVSGYTCGTYSPTQNRIYLVPLLQANQTNWHYIQFVSPSEISTSLMASTLFNKF